MIKDTLINLSKGWFGLTTRGDNLNRLHPDLPTDEDIDTVKRYVDKWLSTKGGEASTRQVAAQIGRFYLGLSLQGKHRFLSLLCSAYGNDQNNLLTLCQRYIAGNFEEREEIENELHHALISPRINLLRQFTALPQGIKFLVDLRADLIQLRKQDDALAILDRELRNLLRTWFDIGLLDMEQITWNSPASLLEKLISYESVHHIGSWQDLRHRLVSDRHCYAFFHRNMQGEPLIFVEVALVNGIARSVQDLLDASVPGLPPEEADTAIFYSISNAQKGLRGISFGNFLIKRVVEKLRHELPNISTFSTLSPIPGFCRWIQNQEAEDLKELLGEESWSEFNTALQKIDEQARISSLLTDQNWSHHPETMAELRPSLESLLFTYFHQRRSDNQPIDPVERFHLGNGARIEQINWQGDRSENGIKQSLGFMVNYVYSLKDIDSNHEQYATERTITISPKLRSLKKEMEARNKKK